MTASSLDLNGGGWCNEKYLCGMGLTNVSIVVDMLAAESRTSRSFLERIQQVVEAYMVCAQFVSSASISGGKCYKRQQYRGAAVRGVISLWGCSPRGVGGRRQVAGVLV